MECIEQPRAARPPLLSLEAVKVRIQAAVAVNVANQIVRVEGTPAETSGEVVVNGRR